jgi:hypothetical protein
MGPRAIGYEVRELDARLTGPSIYSLLIDGVADVADVSGPRWDGRRRVADETSMTRLEEAIRHVLRTEGGAAGGPAPRR